MKCVVKNCTNNRNNNVSKKAFFSFPKKKNLLRKWLQFCKNDNPYKPETWRVCMDHFNDEDICGHSMHQEERTLRPGAIPYRYNITDANEIIETTLEIKLEIKTEDISLSEYAITENASFNTNTIEESGATLIESGAIKTEPLEDTNTSPDTTLAEDANKLQIYQREKLELLKLQLEWLEKSIKADKERQKYYEKNRHQKKKS